MFTGQLLLFILVEFGTELINKKKKNRKKFTSNHIKTHIIRQFWIKCHENEDEIHPKTTVSYPVNFDESLTICAFIIPKKRKKSLLPIK